MEEGHDEVILNPSAHNGQFACLYLGVDKNRFLFLRFDLNHNKKSPYISLALR